MIALNFSDLQLNDTEPIYVQIAQHVKLQIALRKISSGHWLPSRRELAAQLKVNPNTVQKAYKLMEEEGYVRTSGNQGSRVHYTDEIAKQIEQQLTGQMVREFIGSAKALNLSFKQVIDLISDLWE